MTTLQEQFEKDYPNKGVKGVYTFGNYKNDNFTNRDLDLRGYKNLIRLDLSRNNLTSIDLTNQKYLNWLNLLNNKLTSVELLPGWKEKTWKEIRDETQPKIPGLEKLIDTSDLDNWVKNYDDSKIGDIEYHKICGGGGSDFVCLDYIAIDNLGNKIIARKLIVLSRLLVSKADLEAGKNKLYEEKMNELAERHQKCGYMNLPGKTPDNPWTKEKQQEVVNKALNGDIELLSRLQDLPYLNPKYKLTPEELKIKELQTQIQNLQTKITELETKLTQAQEQIKKIPELEKEITHWKTKYEKVINFLKEIKQDLE